jgi:dipeptidyl aminopeptidase/acylaminoacyl peptidase
VATVLPGAAAARGGGQLTVIASRAHRAPIEILALGTNGRASSAIGRFGVLGEIEPLTWSPDGQGYAYIDPGLDFPTLQVARAGASEGAADLGAPEYGSSPLFDRHGDVVYPTTEPYGVASVPGYETGIFYTTVLWAAPTDGAERRQLASFGPGVQVLPYSAAADGTIAAMASTLKRSGIVLFKLGKPTLRWLIEPAGGEVSSPAISPDGSRIVYLSSRVTGSFPQRTRLLSTKLMSVSVRGGKPRVLATIPGGARWPSWDPSGSRIHLHAARHPRTNREFLFRPSQRLDGDELGWKLPHHCLRGKERRHRLGRRLASDRRSAGRPDQLLIAARTRSVMRRWAATLVCRSVRTSIRPVPAARADGRSVRELRRV